MRKIIFVLLYGILWGVLPLRAQKLVPAIKPNATQQAMQKRAYGMFIHFGINTFCQQEWSDGSIPALTYNPTNLAYIIHSGFISGYQNRYGDNLKPPTNVYHRMTA